MKSSKHTGGSLVRVLCVLPPFPVSLSLRMRRVAALFVAAALLLAGAPVDAKRHHHVAVKAEGKDVPATPSTLHPELTATPETLALWAQRRAELEARNYSRPTPEQLVELGFTQGKELGSGTFGVDVSSWVGESTWACMKGKGYSFAIVREFQETCNVDPNGVHSVANAWAGGMAHVDVYLFPSYGCGISAATQMDRTIDSMGSIPFGTVWIDIESGGQGSAANNHAWLMAALAQGVKRIGAKRMGVYSSRYEWGLVMGGYSGPTEYPIWYANYDGVPSFANFPSFAGWTRPAMKQFAGSSGMCSASVDLNWY